MSNRRNFPDDYRFGFNLEDMKQEVEDHKPIMRIGCFVPSVKDVREMSVDDLRITLDLWLWESPTTLIPSDDQILEVISVLRTRTDVDDCGVVLDMCYRYVKISE